jgi:hypothetical protein
MNFHTIIDKIRKDSVENKYALTRLYGKGFSRANLLYMRKLYLNFPKSETLSNVLSWSHYFEILRSDNELEINFYAK